MIIWVLKILRLFFSLFDKITFWAVEMIYGLFMNIASAGIFSQATIQEFASRIYVFLGLIMVFKVSISLVSYIMNPDNFSKGDVGAPALLKGFIFALVGIVLVPYVFEIAYSIQRAVLKENVIGNLIMGMGAEENENFTGTYIQEGGKNMAATVLSAFYKPDSEALGLSEACAVDPIDSCQDELKAKFDDDIYQKFVTAFQTNPRDVDAMLDGDILNATWQNDNGDTVFIMDYTFIISTICGLFVVYILFLFCVDISVRSVKLSFLQLIAPIPLISKIDPKKGDKVFGNWMKECTTTYLDVFIRLLAIYFALFIISAISNKPVNMVTGEEYTGFTGMLLTVFLIIGALNFARELPKLLGSVLGIDFKGMGGFSLNPMKNKNFAPIGAAAALGSSMASGTARGFRENGVLGALGGFAGGAFGGVARAGGNLMSGKNWSDIVGAQNAYNRDMNMASAQGSTAFGRARAAMSNAFGLPNDLDRRNREEQELLTAEQAINDFEAPIKAGIEARKRVSDSVGNMENRAIDNIKNGSAGQLSARYNDYVENINAARNSGDAARAASLTQELNEWMNSNERDGAASQYIDAVLNGGTYYDSAGTAQTLTDSSGAVITDGTMNGMYDDYVSHCNNIGETARGRSASDLHSHSGGLKRANSADQRRMVDEDNARAGRGELTKAQVAQRKQNLSSEKREAQANANAANKGFTGPGGGK